MSCWSDTPYNGNTIPLVAARRPVRHLVYLCAMVPDIGRSVFDQMSDELEMLNPVAYEQGLSVPDEQLRRCGPTSTSRARCSMATVANRS